MFSISLDAGLARRFAARARKNVETPYPFHLLHLVRADADIASPSVLHPAFHGSYDWHSCVHMCWTLSRCARLFPDVDEAEGVLDCLEARLTPERLEGERAYFEAPGRESFERPYGWAWLFALATELDLLAEVAPRAVPLRDAARPFARFLARRLARFLPRLEHPVRAGTHGNTAFALVLALDHARATHDDALTQLIEARARAWFAGDRAYPARYEPSGDDFLSGGLCEAVLMSRILAPEELATFWRAFAPQGDELTHWLTPVHVSDADDAKLVHLHGLNLSRAWCWRVLCPSLPEAERSRVDEAITAHLAASLDAATSGAYVGTHWLASFALLALSATDGGLL